MVASAADLSDHPQQKTEEAADFAVDLNVSHHPMAVHPVGWMVHHLHDVMVDSVVVGEDSEEVAAWAVEEVAVFHVVGCLIIRRPSQILRAHLRWL